jgi:hypothetical protein
MLSLMRVARTAGLVAVIALSGCLKAEQVFTIYPDGSGKVEIKQTLFGPAAMGLRAQMQGQGRGPGGGGDRPGRGPRDIADVLKRSMRGKVYWANLETGDGEMGEIVLSGSGYFENIADIKSDIVNLTFAPDEGGGHVLSLSAQIPDRFKRQLAGLTGMGRGGAPLTPEEEQRKAMLKPMLAGFDLTFVVIVPGEIKSSEGPATTEGRKATLRIGEDQVETFADLSKAPPAMKIVSGPSTVTAEEIAAFKKELEAAKAAALAEEEPAKPAAEQPKPALEGGKKPEDEKREF